METRAVARFVRIAPRKARKVIDQIRGKGIDEALGILEFTPRLAAETIAKVVKSAAANAEHNHSLSRDSLVVAEAFVDQGPTLKRVHQRAQGRMAMIHKRSSHITVILREKEG
jgi:large subunit ribosomal protein L22